MKYYRLIAIVIVAIMMSACDHSYMEVMLSHSGEIDNVRDGMLKKHTSVGDTIVVSQLEVATLKGGFKAARYGNYQAYALYRGAIPDYRSITSTDSSMSRMVYYKAVRLQ